MSFCLCWYNLIFLHCKRENHGERRRDTYFWKTHWFFFFCYCKTTLVPLLINIAGRYFTNLQLLLPNFPYPSLLNPLTHTCTHTLTPQTHTNWSSLKSHVAFGKYFIIASQVDFLTLLPIWTWTISYSCLYQWY